jgi:hypothetical protein
MPVNLFHLHKIFDLLSPTFWLFFAPFHVNKRVHLGTLWIVL